MDSLVTDICLFMSDEMIFVSCFAMVNRFVLTSSSHEMISPVCDRDVEVWVLAGSYNLTTILEIVSGSPAKPSEEPGLPLSRLTAGVERGLRVHEKGDNETVKTQDFGENEDQNHTDEKSGLLSSSAHTGVTNNTNSETSGKTSKTDGETSTELDEAGEKRKLLRKTIGDQDRNDETVDTNDTSHNDGDNVW